MNESTAPGKAGAREVLLVGGMPALPKAGESVRPSAADVFELVAGHLGPLAPRIPDGEQLGWIRAVWGHLAENPGLERTGTAKLHTGLELPVYALKGDSSENFVLGPYGYADSAIASYSAFKRLGDRGTIPAGTRYQVTLPTPMTTTFQIEAAADQLLPAAEAAMAQEVDRIVEAIPAGDLAIQWDLAAEAGQEEQRRQPKPPDMPSLFKRHSQDDLSTQYDAVARLADRIPDEVELGFHLCNGHGMMEPEDASAMRDVVNALVQRVTRPITYFHVPVQVAHSDDPAYFLPLRAMETASETEVYLGLVYLADGVDGATRRIKAAESAISGFGIAAECGFGRMAWDDVPAVLDLHRAVAETV